jgi:hypothetical protein
MLPLETVTPVPATGFFTLAWLLIAIPAGGPTAGRRISARLRRWPPS